MLRVGRRAPGARIVELEKPSVDTVSRPRIHAALAPGLADEHREPDSVVQRRPADAGAGTLLGAVLACDTDRALSALAARFREGRKSKRDGEQEACCEVDSDPASRLLAYRALRQRRVDALVLRYSRHSASRARLSTGPSVNGLMS
jgi:hypothetical protein